MSDERDRSVLLLLTGGFAVWLAVSGVALNFVRPSMRAYVLVAGIVTMLLAVLPPGGLLSRARGGGGHDHDHGDPKVSWLLVVPLLVVIVVPPAPLGANAIRSRLASASSGPRAFPALRAPERGAVPMSMAEFSTRALRDPDHSLQGVRVRLTGFVSESDDASFRLARFVIFCCAADAEAVEVVVHGDAADRSVNDWYEVEGMWEAGAVPTVRADSARRIDRPKKPYEFTTVWSG